MKIKLKYSIILLFAGLLSSCADFLDRAPDSNLDEDKVFTVFVNAEKFQADIYSNLQARFNLPGDYNGAPLSSASDESDSQYGYQSTTILNNGGYDGVDNVIYNNYEGIRKANKFLSKVEVIPFPTESDKNRLVGETYFLRAFYFDEIIKRYGGMPIMDETNMLMPGDDLSKARNTYKECVTFILSDLEKAISMLPATVSENQYGRITKGAAMALKSRVLLYAASPLWQKEMQEDLWAQAADAALAVIDLTDNGAKVYELYNTGNGADDYEKLFFTRREAGNKEVIFYKHESPIGFTNAQIQVWAPNGGKLGGLGSVCPTQNFVDLFEMSNGKAITDPNSGYNANDPFKNRDPRFYKIVLYNGVQWQGETLDLTFDENKSLSGTHRQDKTYTRTGYYVRKYLPADVKNNSSNTSYHNWIYIRLAEMYLNYAEAINEASNSADNRTLAIAKLNELRARSGVVAIPSGLSQDDLRKRIWNERAIELSFEEHRWWDARRWQQAEKWFGGTMYEMEIRKTSNGQFSYEVKPFFNRVFRSNMNLYPIPVSDMRKNPLYVQNPGW